MKPHAVLILTAAAVFATCTGLNAQQAIYDGFATGSEPGHYPPGDDASAAVGGGTNWSQPSWKNAAQRKMVGDPEGLTYSDGTNELASTEGSVASPKAEGNAELERDFQSFGAGTEVWFSILMDRAPTGHGFEDRFAFQLRSQTGDLKYSIRALDGSKNWHASYKSQGTSSEEIATIPETTYDKPTFFVGRISSIGSMSATFSVWANPKNLKNLGEPTWTSPEFHAPGFGRAVLVADSTRDGRFDEIRIGTSEEEVVPIKGADQ